MSNNAATPISPASLKEWVSVLRDVILTLLIATVLIYPASLKYFLNESGLSKLSAFGVSLELQIEKDKLATAQTKITEQVLAAGQNKPEAGPPEAWNQPVDPDFLQTVLSTSRVAPELLPGSGWVFLGRVTSDKTRWADGASPTTTATWPVQVNDIVTVKNDLYVRAGGQDNAYSSSPVSTVARVGERLKVVDLDQSPARVGGLFVWAKVALLPP